jgi:predicted phosphodiesterase
MDMCWFPLGMEGDGDTCLIIAGDLWTAGKFLTRRYPPNPGFLTGSCWMELLALRFKYVVIVLGNHDYWDANVLYEPKKIADGIQTLGLRNVFLLERSEVVLDQVKFVGGTLWTDYNRHDPLVIYHAPMIMEPDHRYIKCGPIYARVRAEQLYEIHQNTKTFIFGHAKRDDPEQKVVVVTHMAPSIRSISKVYERSNANHYYYSDMEKRILADGQDIDLWVHGHTHTHNDYVIGNVRVISNARGYRGYESEASVGFQPNFRVDV